MHPQNTDPAAFIYSQTDHEVQELWSAEWVLITERILFWLKHQIASVKSNINAIFRTSIKANKAAVCNFSNNFGKLLSNISKENMNNAH